MTKKHIYPRAVMAKAIKQYNEEFTVRKRSLGELAHPENSAVNLECVSRIVTSLKLVDNEIQGKVIDTPYGDAAKNLLNDGIVQSD